MTRHYESVQWRFGGSERMTYAVQRLILAHCAVFGIQLLLDVPLGLPIARGAFETYPGGIIAHWLSFKPSAFLAGMLWQPFTYMFLHGGLLHLLLNVLWLFMFGRDVEQALGTRAFLRFYVICGAAGVLATLFPAALVGRDSSVVGASGAVMGVLVAFAVINPERELFLFPFPVRLSARGLVLIVIALNILTALQPGRTSVATHFGGMIAGFLYMKSLPLLLGLQRSQQARKRRTKTNLDDIGEEVDNIFKFEDKKRRN